MHNTKRKKLGYRFEGIPNLIPSDFSGFRSRLKQRFALSSIDHARYLQSSLCRYAAQGSQDAILQDTSRP
jgi:hypothetical protein